MVAEYCCGVGECAYLGGSDRGAGARRGDASELVREHIEWALARHRSGAVESLRSLDLKVVDQAGTAQARGGQDYEVPCVGLRGAEVVCDAHGEVVRPEAGSLERLEPVALDGGEIAVAAAQPLCCGEQQSDG